MSLTEFRAEIIKLMTRFVRKWRPFSIQCPLTIQEARHPFYRQKTCETCLWRSNVHNGKFTTGKRQYYCRSMRQEGQYVAETTPACPRYED